MQSGKQQLGPTKKTAWTDLRGWGWSCRDGGSAPGIDSLFVGWFAQGRNVYVVLFFSEYIPLFVKLAKRVVKKYSSEINKHSNEVEKTLPNRSWDTWSETHETCRRSELAQHTHPTHLNCVFNLKGYEAWQCLLGRPVTGWHSSKRHPDLGGCWWETQNFGNDTDPWHFHWWKFIHSSFLRAGLLFFAISSREHVWLIHSDG